MTSCLENIQIPSCVWFEAGEKRNALMSMLAGTLVKKKYILFMFTYKDTIDQHFC